MNGNMANGVTLRVSLARAGKAAAPHLWTAPPPPKQPKVDAARPMITYDDDSPFA